MDIQPLPSFVHPINEELATSMAAQPLHQAHTSRMGSLLETGKYSDLTLVCQGRGFTVHRNVLCPASTFFAAACDGEFKVS